MIHWIKECFKNILFTSTLVKGYIKLTSEVLQKKDKMLNNIFSRKTFFLTAHSFLHLYLINASKRLKQWKSLQIDLWETKQRYFFIFFYALRDVKSNSSINEQFNLKMKFIKLIFNKKELGILSSCSTP